MRTTFAKSIALAVALAGCSGSKDEASASFAPSTGQRSFFQADAAAAGWLPRSGDLVRLDASTHRGTLVAMDGVAAFSWSTDGADVVAAYDAPRTVAFEYRSIGESPAPPDVQSAYRALWGDQLRGRVDLVGARYHPVSGAGATYRVDYTQLQRETWGPFYVTTGTYAYTRERTQAFAIGLRERAASPATRWTPELAIATWAVGSYYAPPGVSGIDGQPFPPAFNGDLLALAPQGVGSSRYSGRTLRWTLDGGYLDVAFSDGSSERLELVDAGAGAYGVWSEHRDAAGTLVAGTYDWAFRAPSAPAATVAAFQTSSTQYWQQMISAWTSDAWSWGQLRWDWTFGWELLADGTGAEVEAWYEAAPGGAQIPHLGVLPITWSVTDTGEVRIDRLTFATGENRAYRLLTPVVIEADGTDVWLIEEEYRRPYGDPSGPYEVWFAPRLTAYERRAIPPAP